MVEPFLDTEKMRRFVQSAVEHYTGAPGWFTDWLEELYARLQEDWRGITLDEVCALAFLYEEGGGWMPEDYAVNSIYKLFDRLKRDTTGIVGF